MTDDFVTLPKSLEPFPDHRLLERYVAGESTPHERIALERWIAAHPEWRDALTTMAVDGRAGRQAWHNPVDARNMEQRVLGRINYAVDGRSPEENRDRAKRAVDDRAVDSGVRDHGTLNVGTYPTLRQKDAWMVRMIPGKPRVARAVLSACGVLIILVAAFFAQQRSYTTPSAASSIDAVSAYTTGNGQRSTITLPDGTQVFLNVASRLEVPTDYHAGNRTLHLEGEALFSVVAHEKNPLVVNSGGTATRVLGTRFVVRRYRSDSATTVAVQEGKVSVQGSVVAAAQRVVVDSLGVSPILVADPSQFSFADGRLALKHVPLADAISDLNRWYDTEIKLGDSVLGIQELTGDFKVGSLTDLVAILELALPVRVERVGRILTLYPRR